MAQPVQDTEPITPEGAERLRIRGDRGLESTGRAPEQARSDVLTAGLRPDPQLKIAVRNIIPNRRVRNENLRGTMVDSVVSFEEAEKTREFARAP